MMSFNAGGNKGASEPVTAQPKSGFVNVPYAGGGNAVLADFDEVILEQKTEKEMPEKDAAHHLSLDTEFVIMNSRRQPILNSVEESDFCLRAMWGRLRPLHIRVNDLTGEAILFAYRRHNCCRCGCCCQCCHEALLVEMNDLYVGQIQHKRRWWKPRYPILDEHGSVLYTIEGRRAPACRTCCRPLDVKFNIKKGGAIVGEIKKHRRFFLPDVIIDRPYTAIMFPTDANVVEKALIICAAFYIEVHYWDEDPLTFMK